MMAVDPTIPRRAAAGIGRVRNARTVDRSVGSRRHSIAGAARTQRSISLHTVAEQVVGKRPSSQLMPPAAGLHRKPKETS